MEIAEINSQIELLKIEQKHYGLETIKDKQDVISKFESQIKINNLSGKQKNELYKSIIDCIIWTRKANIINIEIKFN